MNGDIRFYDFDFNLLYILPEFSETGGYSSINVKIELNGSGSLEIVFADDDLEKIIAKYKDTLIIKWRDFWGFITGFTYKEKEKTLTGMHLNGLLHRAVIPKTDEELSGDVQALARSAIEDNVPWLTLGNESKFENTVSYSTDKYEEADTYIQNLLKLDNSGYSIRIDIPTKKYIFECIKPKKTELLISESKLNAHSFSTVYNNKELAFGGWYLQEQPDDKEGNKVDSVWTYKTLDSTKSGIHKIDTILEAVNDTEAENELKLCAAQYTVSAETKDILHGEDFEIGDIVRVQDGGITVKKLITGVKMWNENGYGEEPIFEETEATKNE